jgi:hypothetical protein
MKRVKARAMERVVMSLDGGVVPVSDVVVGCNSSVCKVEVLYGGHTDAHA